MFYCLPGGMWRSGKCLQND